MQTHRVKPVAVGVDRHTAELRQEPRIGSGQVVVMSVSQDDSDARLWALACAGDAHAFTLVYDRYSARVYSYCFRSTGSWSSAQDLASTVWLETWRTRRRVSLGSGNSLAPWIFGVAHNVIRNSKRAQRRHWVALARLPNSLDAPDHADDVAARLDEESRMTMILRRVNELPRHERDVLVLVAWAGLNQSEVAVALGIRVGTVKSRLFRARERLGRSKQLPFESYENTGTGPHSGVHSD